MPRKNIIYHVFGGSDASIVAEVQFADPDEDMAESRGLQRVRRCDVWIAYDATNGIAQPARKDQVTVDGDKFDVIDWGEKQGGHWRLQCIRAETITHAPARYRLDRTG